MFIILLIYLFFLRENLISNFKGIAHIDQYIDSWMLDGLISIVAVTTALSMFGQKIEDKRLHKIDDFRINRQLNENQVSLLYIISAMLEGIISTSIFMVICYGYLSLNYQINLFNLPFLRSLLLAYLLVIFSCTLLNLLTVFLNTISAFSGLSSLVGTLTGFLSGTYIV